MAQKHGYNIAPNGQENHLFPIFINDKTESITTSFFDTNPDIVDCLVVELRTGTDANTEVSSKAVFLKSDGSIVDLEGTSNDEFTGLDLNTTSSYVVTHYCNHLLVMSTTAILSQKSPTFGKS